MNESYPSKAELRENVVRGFNYMNEHYDNWQSKINKSTLDMTLFCGCILGQVDESHDYTVVMEKLGNPYCDDVRELAESRGFYIVPRSGDCELSLRWKFAMDELRQVWLEVLAAPAK
jgi:hypothetical protein